MSKRNYEISKRTGAKMWTCTVTNSYGETHTNYFETEVQCHKHVYYTWENEDNYIDSNELLSKAIEECIKLDEKRGVEPSLD
jgi:hypothetical protein|tara:strand:+ start:321 stop:566 length:246 start_codon:yes stop_codon:yes gene_type:complete